MKIVSYSFLFLALLVVSACGPSGNSFAIRTEALELKAEGPLFEGSNMAQATWEFDVAEVLRQNQIDGSTITRAQISGIQIQYTGEPIDMQKIVLEVTSKSVDMSRVALYEGEILVNSPMDLGLAQKQANLADGFMKDGRITFVADFDLNQEEYWEDVVMELYVTFELLVK
ncbi:MAG: hypothetical protein ACXIT9_01335 [Nitritalea sp.]